jgi:hypothetical protein
MGGGQSYLLDVGFLRQKAKPPSANTDSVNNLEQTSARTSGAKEGFYIAAATFMIDRFRRRFIV